MSAWSHSEWRLLHAYVPACSGPARAPLSGKRDFKTRDEGTEAASLAIGTLERPRAPCELVQYARRNPGSLTYGVAGVGNELHLAWEALRNAASLDVLLVPYQGTSPAMRDVIAGHVSLFMTATSTVKGYLDDGVLRGLAVFSDQRLTQFPSISTVKESGFPDLNIPAAWFGVFAPANTPDEVVVRLYNEIEQISVEPAYRQQMALIGIEPTTLPPDAFARIVRQNHAQWGELIRSAKIKVD